MLFRTSITFFHYVMTLKFPLDYGCRFPLQSVDSGEAPDGVRSARPGPAAAKTPGHPPQAPQRQRGSGVRRQGR